MSRGGDGSSCSSEAHTSKAFDQRFAQFTKTNLQLQNGKLLTRLSAVDNDVSSPKIVLSCDCLFLEGTREYLFECERKPEGERGKKGGLRSLCVGVRGEHEERESLCVCLTEGEQ